MISTKGRYAIRLIIDVAENSNGSPVTLDAIATRQGISKKYLESIVKLLVTGKLVKGTSGKGGGYSLTKLPEEYHILDILELTEGSLSSYYLQTPYDQFSQKTMECRNYELQKQQMLKLLQENMPLHRLLRLLFRKSCLSSNDQIG